VGFDAWDNLDTACNPMLEGGGGEPAGIRLFSNGGEED
jgi:hypothetical protein